MGERGCEAGGRVGERGCEAGGRVGERGCEAGGREGEREGVRQEGGRVRGWREGG